MASTSAAAAAAAAAAGPASSGGGSMPTPAAAIDFLMLLSKLKTTKRTGWVRCNVQQPESIADHMYRMGLMSLLASDAGADASHCMALALVHDAAEALVGDITPHCGVSDADKHELEAAAIRQMRDMLGPDTTAGVQVEALWREYEGQATPAAQLVKDFDKLEMIIQAHEYERDQGLQLQQFFDSTAGRFKTATGKAWAEELIRRRTAAAAVPADAAEPAAAAEVPAADAAADVADGSSVK